ncbi:uncharacterized protein [Linepithema humile]|uniref:uncharacterized protein isoform X1 n=1 Tax=Linepithema humile TaxID=83485 RepID=UPI00351F3358
MIAICPRLLSGFLRSSRFQVLALPIARMRCLLVGVVFFTCNCLIRGQDVVFPTDEETSHVSGGNSTVITDRLPVLTNDCPKNMLLYPGDGSKSNWVCDCRPRFLYFPLNDSCHEAYMQGPCPPGNYVVLPEDESVPHCAVNPCGDANGVVPFNGTCYALRTIGGPCAPDGVIGVNETNFQLECVSADIAPFMIINAPKRPSSKCPPGSRRSTQGICKQVRG